MFVYYVDRDFHWHG